MAGSIGAGAAVIGAGTSLWSAVQQGGKSEDALNDQADAARRLSKISKEQWNIYKEKIFPLEQQSREMGITAQELALQRGKTDAKLYEDFYAPLQEQYVGLAKEGIKPQYEQVAREAAKTTNQAFDVQAGAQERALSRRGVMPTSGQYRAAGDQLALGRAAATAEAQNTARMNERNRVEDVNFNRMGTALGRQPTYSSPSQSVAGASFPSIAGLGTAANIYGNQAATYGAGAVNTLQGGLNLIQQGADLYKQFATPSTPNLTPGNTSYSPDFTSSNPWANPLIGGPNKFNEGGPVRDYYQDGGPILDRRGGMVEGPPGVDQVQSRIIGRDGSVQDASLTAGEYVIPPEVVMRKGTEFFDRLIEKGEKGRKR